MSSALLRHAAPLLSIRAPIFAGLGTAIAFALVIAGVALFGEADLRLPVSRGEVGPLADTAPARLRNDTHTTADSITFHEPDDGEEVSLSGVSEGFRTPASTSANSNHTSQTAPVSDNPDALVAAPIQGLFEPGPGGLLPVITENGLRPSRAYARPFHGDPTAPTIAIVVGGMGLNERVTQTAIDTLPPEVALSFAPYTPNLQNWINRAREAGHEVLVEAPMEPFDYPNNDPGPHTLLADGPTDENERRLSWLLSRTTGYFAITNYLGARFSASETAVEHVFGALENRGIAFIHDGAGRRSTVVNAGASTDIDIAIADRILDEDPSRTAIDNRLLALEALALQNGTSLGSGFSYPVTVELVAGWASNLDARGYQLAPPSAVMARRRLDARLEREEAARRAAAAPPRQEASHDADDDHASGTGH